MGSRTKRRIRKAWIGSYSPLEELLTVQREAELLVHHPQTIYKAIKAGRLPHVHSLLVIIANQPDSRLVVFHSEFESHRIHYTLAFRVQNKLYEAQALV